MSTKKRRKFTPDETISGDDIGVWANTVSYEIFTSIGQRYAKEYLP